MEEVAYRYQALLCKCIQAQSPEVPFFSSVSGKLLKEGEGVLDAAYWTQNLVSPVLFSPAVSAILQRIKSPSIFLEIGPHCALAGPVRQIAIASEASVEHLPTLIRNNDGEADLLRTAGELWLRNVSLNFGEITRQGKFIGDLPLYPWRYENSHWAESRLSREWRLREFPQHDLLGSRITESTSFDPNWRSLISLDNVSWIQEHVILGDILLPGAGFVCMMAEAIRQLSGHTEFSMRQVCFNAPLLLQHGPPVEVVINLHRVRLTTNLDSAWYHFSISSLKGTTWVRHCLGQVKGGFDNLPCPPKIEAQKRFVSSQKWYSVMREQGLEYGPRFSGMTAISTDPNHKIAVATTQNDVRKAEQFHTIHPASLDCASQLFSVAAYHGLQRCFRSPAIPSYIEELCIRPPKGEILMQARAENLLNGTLSGDLVAVSEGELIIAMRGLRLSSISDSITMSNDPHTAAQLVWKPDLNLVDACQLIRPQKRNTEIPSQLGELTFACMLETHHKLGKIKCSQPHYEKYQGWLESQLKLTVEEGYTDVPNCASLTEMTSDQRSTFIRTLFEQIKKTEAAVIATAIHRVVNFCEDIVSGATDPLDLLQRDGILERLYEFIQQSDFSQFLGLAAHRNPTLRVLEIGAGAGCNTSIILPYLEHDKQERMYSSYTYTDKSASYFPAAKERFKAYQAMEYTTLDISKDPIEQGFELASFDLVVACNVLRTAPKLNRTLKHVRSLIKPSGRLLLQGLCSQKNWFNYVMGVLPDWWACGDDERISQPFADLERWNKELRDAGYEEIKAVAYDGCFNNNIVAVPARAGKGPKRITILYEENWTDVMDIEKELRKAGYEIDFCTINQTPTPYQDIVSLLDIGDPFIHSLDGAGFNAFRDFVANLVDCGILWVTGATQISCQNPRYGLIHGMARTIRNELSIDFAILELESFDPRRSDVVCKVLKEFQDRTQQQDTKCTMEWALSWGEVQISRYHRQSVREELLEPRHRSSPVRLDMDKPGLAKTLHWRQSEPIPLASDEVELEVRAVGLNYKV